MPKHDLIHENELEEAAQGQELFRAPGQDLQIDQAHDQAIASGWLPPAVVAEWPSTATTRSILERRRDLYGEMRRLEASVARASGQPDWIATVAESLRTLSEALDRHVDEIEGPGGLFDEIMEIAPRLSSAVADLRAEHRRLIDLGSSAASVVSAGGDPEDVRSGVLRLLGTLAVHRQTGAELLFDAYNVDVSVGD